MPRKISSAEKREWLKLAEQGNTEASIATRTVRDLRTIRKGIEEARREHDAANANAEIIKGALLNHQNQLLSVIKNISAMLQVPPANMELRRQQNGAIAPISLPGGLVKFDLDKGLILEIQDENKVQWVLLQEHLKRDKMWKLLTQWKEKLLAHMKARSSFFLKAETLLKIETGYRIHRSDKKPEEACFVHLRAVELFYGVAMKRLLGVLDGTDPEHNIIDTPDGYVRLGMAGSELAYSPGSQAQCKNNILEAFKKLQKSEEARQVASTHTEVSDITIKAKKAVEDADLLGMVPGRCRICRRLGI